VTAVPGPGRQAGGAGLERRSGLLPAGAEAAPARLPHQIEPMLPVAVNEPFDSPSHLFEVKWDGIRALAFFEGGTLRLQDRFQRDVTHAFPELSAVAGDVGGDAVVLDGAIVALDADGRPDFRRLQPRLWGMVRDDRRPAFGDTPVVYEAFDALYYRGQSVMGYPLRRRKEILHDIVRPGPRLGVPEFVEKEGIAFFAAAREHELEGVVAKEKEGMYQPGKRSRAWLTLDIYHKDEFVIGGYTYGGRPRSAKARQPRQPFASLMLGLFDSQGRLAYVGEVSGGFTGSDTQDIIESLDAIPAGESPFVNPPRLPRLIFWCRPEMSCTVRFAGWSRGRLQFPVFEALRPDMPAGACLAR